MKILVTGGSGFIGSHLVDKLLEKGHAVRVFDLKEPYRNDVDFIKGDLLLPDEVNKAVQDVDVVFHFAAFSNIDLVKSNPLDTVKFNVLGTANLLEACRDKKLQRFILASSVFVFDEKGHLYTATKYSSELICRAYHTLYAIPYTIIRCGTVYGPRSRDADVISLFIIRSLKGEQLIVKGSGNQQRNFIYVEDLAKGCVEILNVKAENKTYVLAGREMVSINDLVDIFRNNGFNKLGAKKEEGREDDYRGDLKDADLIYRELGWMPKTGLKEGIARTMEWYKGRKLD